MSPALAAIPALSRDDFETVLVSYQSYQQELLTLESVLGIMKEAYPLGDEEAFKAGLPVIDEALLTAYKQDHERLLRETKLPQLFISPDSGFFVDDNLDFINSATSRGWSEHRAIHCPPAPHDSQILVVAQAIRSGFPDESTN